MQEIGRRLTLSLTDCSGCWGQGCCSLCMDGLAVRPGLVVGHFSCWAWPFSALSVHCGTGLRGLTTACSWEGGSALAPGCGPVP
jgi:hypothetical protein